MYGKWLFKEIKTEYGLCKVEIFRKNFTDTAIEIGALESNSLTLAMENLGNITDPIGKSVCSFSIIDTDQIDYDEFFTPDATAYMVVVSTKTGEGAYVTRWSGYVTPDFFAENLSYRTPISISARDNIGYLNDVDFDLDAATITVRELIQAAFNRIAEDYPMSLVFETTKQTAEGILAIDATISTVLLQEKSWYEVLETILHDLGMQMRWVDNNTIAVFDVSQLSEKFSMQRFNFIENSGYREILPAWRELSQKQDYGLRENFFEGWLKSNALTYVKSQSVKLPIPIGQAGTGSSATMKYYAPNNWGVAGNTYTINPEDFAYLGAYGQASTPFGKRIYFTGVDKADTTIAQNYMSWRQDVNKSNEEMQISFKAFNSLLGTSYNFPDTLLAYNPAERFLGINLGLTTGDYIQLGLKVNIFLHVGTKTYIMRNTWEEISGAETSSLYFILDKVGDISEADNTPKEQEITIKIGNMPAKGQLELRIYGFTLEDKKNLQEDAKLATYDWLRMVSYIDDVTYSYANDNKSTGVMSGVEIASLHNIKASEDYSFGQVTMFSGGINAYAGGLYNANGDELVGFKRNADGTTYPLLELVGREIIHFNKRNYTKLSGTVKNLSKEPLGFNKLFVYNGKNYLPFACSLDVISNTMNVTTMQEVEPYITHSFVEIKSELVTGGGATVSGGNNTALQYSAEVGNAKRISELNNASESEKKESYIIIDNASWNESKKVPLSEMEGLNEEQVEAYLTEKKYATQSWVKGITDDLETDIANRVLVTDFEKVDTSVKSLLGYFDSSGNAYNALKLGGQLPSYYATKSALDTTNGNVVSLTQRMGTAEGTIKGHTDAIVLNANNIASNANSITAIQSSYVDKSSAQDISGVKTFKNGLKIGDAELVWDSSNKALKIVGSAYITKDLSFGGYQAPGGGGTSGGGIVTIKVNGQEYTSQNGIVTLPSYPSLAGYATEDYVTSRGYITGITSAMVTSALGYTPYNSSNPSGYITASDLNDYATQSWVGDNYLGLGGGTITTSSVYGLGISSTASSGESGIMLSNNGEIKGLLLTGADWGVALVNTVRTYNSIGIKDDGTPYFTSFGNGTYTLYHTGNFNPANYLPLSGGTINGDYNALKVKRNNNYGAFIQYENNQGVLGILGIDTDGTPILFRGSQLNNADTILHSGNYSSYALPLDGGTMKGNFTMSYNGSTGDYLSYGIYFQDYIYSAFLYTANGTLYYDATYNAKSRVVILSDNIKDYNAGSATKLQTARSIWGRSFDGSGDVSGDILNAAGGIYLHNTNEINSFNGALYLNHRGTNSPASYGITGPIVMCCHGGNILMGTTADNGAKLQVEGNVTASGSITSKAAAGFYHWSVDGGTLYSYIGHDNSGGYTWLYNGISGGAVVLYDAGGINLTQSTTIMGSLTVTGDITFGSDARYKNKITDVEIDLATIANAPLFIYKWNDREDDREHLGTTAQYWFDTAFKNAVIPTNDEKLWTMSYSEIAIGNTIILAREQIKVKSRVQVLEEKVKQLEGELEKYRRVA